MTSFIRFKSEQEDRVEREMRAPLNITREQWLQGKGSWPVGSVWLSMIGAYGPKGSAVQPDKRTGTE
jgi:hypothetical protein